MKRSVLVLKELVLRKKLEDLNKIWFGVTQGRFTRIIERIFFIEFYFLRDVYFDCNFSDKSEEKDIKFQRKNALVSFHL